MKNEYILICVAKTDRTTEIVNANVLSAHERLSAGEIDEDIRDIKNRCGYSSVMLLNVIPLFTGE